MAVRSNLCPVGRELDAFLLDRITLVNTQAKSRFHKQTVSELHFDCQVQSIGERETRLRYDQANCSL